MIRFNNWLCAWADLACGLLGVITLTIYRPWWDMKFRAWISKRYMEKRINNR